MNWGNPLIHIKVHEAVLVTLQIKRIISLDVANNLSLYDFRMEYTVSALLLAILHLSLVLMFITDTNLQFTTANWQWRFYTAYSKVPMFKKKELKYKLSSNDHHHVIIIIIIISVINSSYGNWQMANNLLGSKTQQMYGQTVPIRCFSHIVKCKEYLKTKKIFLWDMYAFLVFG